MAVKALGDAHEVRELIGQCLAGNRDSVMRFQAHYGELIYGFPRRAYRTPRGEIEDFYVFAFTGGRIFRRSQTYEGRAPFQAYLTGSVLPNLVLEWKRGLHDIETVPLDDSDEGAPATVCADDTSDAAISLNLLYQFLEGAGPAKAVILKLLCIEDFDLSPAEVRHLSGISSRSVADTLQGVERLRASVRNREAAAKNIEEKLDEVQGWIELYERRRHRIAEEISLVPQTSTAAARLRDEDTELARKIKDRREQRDKVLARRRRRTTTAPYEEIAALLNTSVGNVGSQITRLRRELKAWVGRS